MQDIVKVCKAYNPRNGVYLFQIIHEYGNPRNTVAGLLDYGIFIYL